MKIGIMTMHRVQNMGSVLQAYALQYKIKQLGYKSELIDYAFPPSKEKQFGLKDLVSWGWDMIHGFPEKKRKKKIEEFRKRFLSCSEKTYDRNLLLSEPPQYDLYCTGSDQVWNPFHVGEDTSFMMDFAPVDTPRIAYASSFATREVDEPYFSLYAKYLSRYREITVREESGVGIIKQMIDKEALVVCDPTLLLSSEEWGDLADSSTLRVPKGYILIYLLGYMFNPRPGFYGIVGEVSGALKLPVYIVNPFASDSVKRNIKAIKGAGPADFVRLFKEASFVVTDSFHGAAFATIFNVPMIGVVKDVNNGDGRISTLRSKVGGDNSIWCHSSPFTMREGEKELFRCDPSKVSNLRTYSTNILKRMIENNMNDEHN